MLTKSAIAVAAITVLIAPTPGSAQAIKSLQRAEYPQQWNGNAMSGAYAAAKQSRAKRSAQRGGISQPTDPSAYRVLAPDGRLAGADPDAAIRFGLRRDTYECRY